jgi:hypothetical protein
VVFEVANTFVETNGRKSMKREKKKENPARAVRIAECPEGEQFIQGPTVGSGGVDGRRR